MPLNTRVCRILDIEHPIVLAGVAGACGPELAAAVSNAGGLGVLGAVACAPHELRAWIHRTRTLTDKPFGVDTLLPVSVQRRAEGSERDETSPADLVSDYLEFAESFMEQHGLAVDECARPRWRGCAPRPFSEAFFEAQMEVILDERVAVFTTGLCGQSEWIERLHARGTKVIASVGTVRHALDEMAAGTDVIVARGHEAGGPNSAICTIALTPRVVDAVGDHVPVIAGGGITDGRGFAAALMLGAQGIYVGSAFLAADESRVPNFQKQALIDATEESTVVTRAITGTPCRVLRSAWTEAWERTDIEPLPMPYQWLVAAPVLAAAVRAGRRDICPGIGGQGIGAIRSVRPARQILEDMICGAEAAMHSADARFTLPPRQAVGGVSR